MLLAVATFILLYATITSFQGPLADWNHVLCRALRLGTKIRAWMSAISLPLIFTPAALVVPDLWCGLIALSTMDALLRAAGTMAVLEPYTALNMEFVRIYLVTLCEGFILSALLIGISLLVVLIQRVRYEIEFMKGFSPPPKARDSQEY